jgi:phage-related protein
MVSVPGRNGDVPIDMGHWDNIEVTYKCGLFGIDQSEMGEALMEFRNAIASQIGYQRLSDSYNQNEFRLGLFMAGLEFDAVSMNRAGEFELKFNCKPQRFLTDGEEMIDVKNDWSDLKTASGEVVTFEVADDAAANYTQFKSLVADIEPIQDLHGYDHPWVGGAGKNKLQNTLASQTLNGVTFTVNDDGTVATSGTANGNVSSLFFSQNVELLPSTDYILSGCPSGGGQNTYRLVLLINGEQIIIDYGNGASFTTPETITSAKVYPIILNGTNVNGKVFKPMIRLTTETDATFAPYSNICPISGWDSVEAYVSPTQSKEDGTTHTATFEETVYGGKVDLVSGVLTIDRAMVDLKNLPWSRMNSSYVYGTFVATLGGMAYSTSRNVFLCSAYKPTYNNEITPTDDGVIWNRSGAVVIKDTTKGNMTVAEFKEFLSGKQLVYELAEPRTIQLDPQTINTLVGVNNVWADSGDVSVEYGIRPGIMVNPTQYESSPVIEIEGTGSIGLNDYLIAIDGGSVGEVELASERRVEPIMGSSYPSTITETIDMATTMSLLEDGDAFNISTLTASWLMGDTTKETYTITQQPTDGVASIETATSPRVSAVARFSQLAFVNGEAKTFAEEFIVSGQSSHGTGSVTFTVGVDYDGSHTLTISYGVAVVPLITGVVRSGSYSDIGEIVGNSSKQTFSGQVIIDSETGDAYRIEDGTYISLNKYIQLGAQLPTLRPGANIITYDDTITSLNIAPRWWRL